MTKTLPLTFALSMFVACAATDETPSPSDPAVEEPTTGELAAARVQTTPDDGQAEALAAAHAMARALDVGEVPDFAEDGELSITPFAAPPDRCFSISVAQNQLTVEFETCEDLTGTLVIDVPRFGPTTFGFEDDFAYDGRDIDGSLTLDLVLSERSFSLSGMLDVDGTTIDAEWDVDALGGVELWGSVETDDGVRTASLTTGTEADPLTWSVDCTCPVSGAIEGDVAGTLDAITIDYDDLVSPFDGEDDFPPFEVPVTPVPVTADSTIDFAPGCGAQTVEVSMTDVEVEVSKDDLGEPLEEACDGGEVDQQDCDRAEAVLDLLNDVIRITVPASTAAESLEQEIDELLGQVCRTI